MISHQISCVSFFPCEATGVFGTIRSSKLLQGNMNSSQEENPRRIFVTKRNFDDGTNHQAAYILSSQYYGKGFEILLSSVIQEEDTFSRSSITYNFDRKKSNSPLAISWRIIEEEIRCTSIRRNRDTYTSVVERKYKNETKFAFTITYQQLFHPSSLMRLRRLIFTFEFADSYFDATP